MVKTKSKARGVPYVAAAGLALGLRAWAMVRLIKGGCETEIAPVVETLRVNVNSADQAALQTLPGIGGTYARRIIAEQRPRGLPEAGGSAPHPWRDKGTHQGD